MIELGPWMDLEGARGATLAVCDEVTAAAQLGRLAVWDGQQLVAAVDAPSPEPGRPRIVGNSVYWGDGRLDLATRRFRRLPDVQRWLKPAGSVHSPGSGPAYMPVGYAWSRDASILVASANVANRSGGGTNARIMLFDGSGGYQTTLWEAFDPAPRALWCGDTHIVVGTRRPIVFDKHGSRIGVLEADAPPIRIEADSSEQFLLVVETTRVGIWNLSNLSLVKSWQGRWLDADIAPDGQTIGTLDHDGLLGFVSSSSTTEVEDSVALPDLPTGLALGASRLAVAFGIGVGVRTATMTLRQLG